MMMMNGKHECVYGHPFLHTYMYMYVCFKCRTMQLLDVVPTTISALFSVWKTSNFNVSISHSTCV